MARTKDSYYQVDSIQEHPCAFPVASSQGHWMILTVTDYILEVGADTVTLPTGRLQSVLPPPNCRPHQGLGVRIP